MENCSENYGLQINRAKCHVITMNRVANIHFQDNPPLNIAHEATYFGHNLNHTVDLGREVSQRIQDTKRTWNRLSLYWKDPTTNKKWQLLIYDAVWCSD